MSRIMTRDELLALHEELCKRARDLILAKSNDYSNGDDLFANFRDSMVFQVPPEVGILIRSLDKFKRIDTFVKTGNLQVKSESVEDAIIDVINYMCLLRAYIKQTREMNDEGN